MKEDQELTNGKSNDFIRIPMGPLFDRLLKKPFLDSVSAIEYCRSVCAEYGFTVKQEASANRNIYIYCSREGLPDSQRNPKPSPQRKRPSKRCDCRWRIVLSENDEEQWEFRKSMNPNASEHNHEMMAPEEMVKAWPPEVNEMIIHLARERLQTHDIRKTIKHHFPDITWNERRFYNRLTEERKRMRQRGVVERSQRLLLLSARLCSIVACNEEWTLTVESDLQRMFKSFCQLARLPNDSIQSLVDLDPKMIQVETDHLVSNTHRLSIDEREQEEEDIGSPTKKRKSNAKSALGPQRGIQMVHVPSYTIQVRSSYSRYSVSSTSKSRVYNESDPSSIFALASPTSSSSSASPLPFPQRMKRGVTSPPQSMQNEFIPNPPYQHDYNTSTSSSQGGMVTCTATFSPYTAAFTSSPELPFQFDHIGRSTSQQQQGYGSIVKQEPTHTEQHMLRQQQQNFPLPMIRSNEETHWP